MKRDRIYSEIMTFAWFLAVLWAILFSVGCNFSLLPAIEPEPPAIESPEPVEVEPFYVDESWWKAIGTAMAGVGVYFGQRAYKKRKSLRGK